MDTPPLCMFICLASYPGRKRLSSPTWPGYKASYLCLFCEKGTHNSNTFIVMCRMRWFLHTLLLSVWMGKSCTVVFTSVSRCLTLLDLAGSANPELSMVSAVHNFQKGLYGVLEPPPPPPPPPPPLLLLLTYRENR